MNPAAKPDTECACCPGNRDTDCCDCCYVRQNQICYSICLPISCVVWFALFMILGSANQFLLAGLIMMIAWPVTIALTIAACCCLCFCRMKREEQAPKPTVRNVQYVQQQRPVAQPTAQYVQPMPQQYAPQRYQPVSHAVVVQPQQYQQQPQQQYYAQPPPPPQPAPPPPPQYVAAEATVLEAAPEGANVIAMEPEFASSWDAAGLVAALRAAPPGHKAPAVISHCMRHTEQPLPSDLGLVFDSLATATDAVEVADALAKNVDLTAEAAAAAVNAAPSLARGDVANRFASILSGAVKAQLVASVPGLSPRAPSKGGGFEYF
jgi:hypothetical protein